MNIHTNALKPLPLARCPKCGRHALGLGDNLYQCGTCGKVGTEPVGLRHYIHTDSQGGWAIGDAPVPSANIRWACGVIPGCTHETEAEAHKHRQDLNHAR